MDSGFYAVASGFYVCVFRIPHRRIPDSIGGWILDFKILFWIPDPISWIPDSKAVDSGFYRPKLPGFRVPDYLICGESDFSSNRCPIDPGLISSTEDTNRRLSSKCSDAKNRRGIRLSTYFIIVSTSVTGSVLHQRGLENPV